MLKKVIAILLISFPVILTAQSPSSVIDQETGGVFTNQLDAAFSARETTSGPGFSELTRPYLFGGVDNPQNIVNTGAATNFFAGIFVPGNLTFSFFANLDHTSFGAIQNEIETTVNGVITYDILNYNIIDDNFQLLLNFGSFTTGLLYELYLDENRVIGADYTEIGLTPNVLTDMNGSISSHGFTIPFYMETGKIHHYAELGLTFRTEDNSYRDDSVTDNYIDKSVSITPQILYEIMFPLLAELNNKNQFRSSINFNMPFLSNDKSGTIGGVDTPETNEYPINLGLSVNVEQSLYFESIPWVSLGFIPTINFAYSKSSINPETTVNTGVTTDNGENHKLTTSISFSFPTAVEFLPEDWIFGLMLGVTPTVSYTTATTIDSLPVPGVTQSTIKTWNTGVAHSYSVFVPIPGGYRIDLTLAVNDLWAFNSLRMQLIVPLK